jgi:ribonuclease III
MPLPQAACPQFEQRLGHVFRNQALLQEARTHSTYAYEHRLENLTSNERLEFLGDAVLDLAVGDKLFHDLSQLTEGFMTKTRSLVVCEDTLAELARRLDVGSILCLGRGEEATGGREKNSNLANAMEALFGAVFLDAGYEKVRVLIVRLLEQPIRDALTGEIIHDYKSRLLELAQGMRAGSGLRFCILAEDGPVHERIFTAGVLLDDQIIASGSGGSKKDAEQRAAKAALDKLEQVPGDASCT